MLTPCSTPTLGSSVGCRGLTSRLACSPSRWPPRLAKRGKSKRRLATSRLSALGLAWLHDRCNRYSADFLRTMADIGLYTPTPLFPRWLAKHKMEGEPASPRLAKRSGQQALDHVAVDVGEAVVPALKLEGQLFVVNAEAVQHRRVQIVNRHRILDDVE